MTRIPPINNRLGYNATLFEEVHSLKAVTSDEVRKLYGTVGVDIFEGKKTSILSEEDIKASKKLTNRIKAWWNGIKISDYEENDRLRDVILKYTYNKKIGKTQEVRTLFGECGVSELRLLQNTGYITA